MNKFYSFRIAYVVIFLTSLVLFNSCKSTKEIQETSKGQYVIILSMDGFRWDYADHTSTPNLDRIAKQGVKAVYLNPSFPTKTFPNHYTIATGLYPDHHGLVNNSFYAPGLDKYYKISDRNAVEDSSFYGGEPIWVTAEKQGVTAATFYWVGSEAKIKGIRPQYWKRYANMPYLNRIDTVIRWLQLPLKERPHLVMWYLDEPDHTGHAFGPESAQTYSKVKYLDSLLGIFMDRLENLPIADSINFIITSDHGMGNISNDKVIDLKSELKEKWVRIIQGSNPVFTIKAEDGYQDSIIEKLSAVDGIRAWKSENIPARLHYGTNPRTLDITVVADSLWSAEWGSNGDFTGGTHGYDNRDSDMHTIFYACGPAFKNGFVSNPFNNVDIYNLLAYLLHINPAQNDGNFEHIKPVLKK
jgi:alkaline phosphatase D